MALAVGDTNRLGGPWLQPWGTRIETRFDYPTSKEASDSTRQAKRGSHEDGDTVTDTTHTHDHHHADGARPSALSVELREHLPFSVSAVAIGLIAAGAICILGPATVSNDGTTASARDLFARDVLGRFLSYAMMIGAMAAIISPVLGGFLVLNLGWRAVFFFMAAFAAALIVLISLLFKETLVEKDFRALTPHVLSANFRTAIGNRDFKLYVFCGGFTLTGLVAFLTSASPVFIGRLGLTPIEFGTLFATISASWLVSTFAAARLVGRFGLNATLFLGTLVAAVGGLALAVPVFMGVERTVAIIVPMIVYVIGFGLVLPQSAAGAMSPFPRTAGTTSSLIGFIQNSLGATMATFLSLTAGDSLTLMATAIAASGIAGLIVAAVIITGAKDAGADAGR